MSQGSLFGPRSTVAPERMAAVPPPRAAAPPPAAPPRAAAVAVEAEKVAAIAPPACPDLVEEVKARPELPPGWRRVGACLYLPGSITVARRTAYDGRWQALRWDEGRAELVCEGGSEEAVLARLGVQRW
jgi:hypothetical protein